VHDCAGLVVDNQPPGNAAVMLVPCSTCPRFQPHVCHVFAHDRDLVDDGFRDPWGER